MELINISDLKNTEISKKYKQEISENNEKTHKYKVDDLVEVIGWVEDCKYSGMRLYVIGCTRDCDGTPLYVLGSKGMELYQEIFVSKENVYYNFNSFSGFREDNLKLIAP